MDACTYTRTVGLTTQKHNASGLIPGMDRTGSTTRPNYLFTRCSNITVLLLINGHFPRWSSVSWLTTGSSTSIYSRKEPMAINEISFIMGQIFSCHQQSKHFSKSKHRLQPQARPHPLPSYQRLLLEGALLHLSWSSYANTSEWGLKKVHRTITVFPNLLLLFTSIDDWTTYKYNTRTLTHTQRKKKKDSHRQQGPLHGSSSPLQCFESARVIRPN